MPHQRPRFAELPIQKQRRFWPIIGVLGLRQVGKSTLLRDRLGIQQYVTLDDEDVREEAHASSKNFLARYSNQALIIDEVQKEPKLFDALKAAVDRRKVPGQWFISGSVAFSSKIGIRESLTGRIALVHLYPMTLQELHSKSFFLQKKMVFTGETRFSPEQLAKQMFLGGLPVPAFIRDEEKRNQYWQNWLDTSISRDAAKAYGKGFDPEFCFSLLHRLARALPEGENPSLDFVLGDKRKAKKYIQALEDIFILRRFTVSDCGVGNDFWLFGDSGLASFLSPQKSGAGLNLAIARHAVFNEIYSFLEYNGLPYRKTYFKSQRGSIVDFVIDRIPFRVVSESKGASSFTYHERAVAGAMNKLESEKGYLLAPIDKAYLPKKGVGVLPWTFLS